MSVMAAPPSAECSVGAKQTELYEALKAELDEFCRVGPQVRTIKRPRRSLPLPRRGALLTRCRWIKFAG